MAFVKKTWKDRLVEFAGRRSLKRISGDPNGTMIVDVTRNEGTESQTGDAFSAANMNDLEQRIADGFTEVNNNLTSKHYGNGTTSLVSVLNSVLTFTNIPYPQSLTFSVQSSEGYFICRATAWNNDWIGGIATPGISSQSQSFSFIRKASGGADTVVNFISSGAPTAASLIYNFTACMHGQQASKSIAINNSYSFYIISISGNWVTMSVSLTKTNGSIASANYPGTVNTCIIVPAKDYTNILLNIFTDGNNFAHTVNVFALK